MPDTITTAVPQQTPPQDAILHPAQVYFLSRRLPGIVHLVQYDQSLPYLAVELYEGDEPYTAPDGAAVNIRMAKPVPSTKKVYNPAYGISSDRHTVYIQVTPQMTVVAGCTNPVIEVVVDGGIACTGTLRLEIDPNPVQESDLIDTDEYKTLEEILAEAQAAAQIVQDNEQALQDVHNNLTAIQNAAANAQAAADSAQDAEDAADRAAIESQKALGFRTFYGGEIIPDTNGDLDPSRPMATPTAASVTIKARGDRIAGLTMAGKTTQAGTGDPSPDNIRMIDGVGMYDKCVVLDGSEEEEYVHHTSWIGNPNAFEVIKAELTSAPMGNNDTEVPALASSAFVSGLSFNAVASSIFSYPVVSGRDGNFVVSIPGITSSADAKTYFQQHPLTVWYRSVDYAKSIGPFYTVVELSDDPYRAVGFELNQPLFDGDSLKVGGKSGFDQMLILDETANVMEVNSLNSVYRIRILYSTPVASSNMSASSSYLPLLANYTAESEHFYVETSDRSVYVFLNKSKLSSADASGAKDYFSAHPLIIFYKSVNYTPENDIPVALEKHVMGYAVFDGDSDYTYLWDGSGASGRGSANSLMSRGATWTPLPISSHFIGASVQNAGSVEGIGLYNDNAYFRDSDEFSDLATFKQFLSSQYSADTPVQVIYELATPVSYARLIPTMIAQPGEDDTFTVTGENSLSVLLKPFQDGGNAATIEGHTWADILAAIQAATASTANELLEEKINV